MHEKTGTRYPKLLDVQRLGHGVGLCRSLGAFLHCSSFLGLPYRILVLYLVKPKKATTMETIGSCL